MRTCPFARAACGVSTPLTVSARAIYAVISQGIRSWGLPFEAFPSPLGPTGFRFRAESRAVAGFLGPTPASARVPLRGVLRSNCSARRTPRSAFGCCSLGESVSRARQLRRSRPAASLGFTSPRISPFTLRARLREPSAPGLVSPAFRPSAPSLSGLPCVKISLPSARFGIAPAPRRSGCCPS